ncbi:MAG: hypothetical protein CTY35_00365 [Methylotenera sp.]|uniref:YcbK family protein n=1 Tax=Methylotenera sp. TaxID=2051956 RepID=UPI000D41EBA1|nr:DUF882 domain-containing protein [Methylotenera sp.]PPC84808.1 MAG: hypothetical protein CTY38_00360 [Methylotenera sp.]PPD02168.1 MAG: hypothetical protein CTY35_00365 [Methylotenera sp.]
MDRNRRHFLFAAAAIVATGVAPAIALAASAPVIQVPSEIGQFWEAPREIWLARSATGEQQKVCYWRDGQIDIAGYSQACYMLRDTHINQSVQMDIGLLNLLRAIQGWLVYYNINHPIIVNSAYRSRQTNNKTEGAAKDSFHVKGMAVDITIPGIPSQYLFKLAAAFSGGGLGFYPSKNFVHADTGRIRYWRG